MLCLHLTLDLLHDGQHRRGWVGGRDEHAVALNVFHVLIIGVGRGNACPCVTLEQQVCDALHHVAVLAYDITE